MKTLPFKNLLHALLFITYFTNPFWVLLGLNNLEHFTTVTTNHLLLRHSLKIKNRYKIRVALKERLHCKVILELA